MCESSSIRDPVQQYTFIPFRLGNEKLTPLYIFGEDTVSRNARQNARTYLTGTERRRDGPDWALLSSRFEKNTGPPPPPRNNELVRSEQIGSE